ncbi:50S ribosomal protein L6, partial [Striga asiatica]
MLPPSGREFRFGLEFHLGLYDKHAPKGMSKGEYFHKAIKLNKEIEIEIPTLLIPRNECLEETEFDPSASRIEENTDSLSRPLTYKRSQLAHGRAAVALLKEVCIRGSKRKLGLRKRLGNRSATWNRVGSRGSAWICGWGPRFSAVSSRSGLELVALLIPRNECLKETNFDPSDSRIEENVIVKIKDELPLLPIRDHSLRMAVSSKFHPGRLPLSTYGRGGRTSQGSVYR